MIILHGDSYARFIPGSYTNPQGNVKTSMYFHQNSLMSEVKIVGHSENHNLIGFYGHTIEDVVNKFIANLHTSPS